MSAEIIPIAPLGDVEAAWEAYVTLQREVEADPSLQTDRRHHERRILAHAEFQRLFLATERTNNVVPIGGAR